MRRYIYMINVFLIAIFFFAVVTSLSNAQNQPVDDALIEALRLGGYNIYFRHAATDWSQNDHVQNAGDWTSCDPEQMRQLSEDGRMQASRIGKAIRHLNIPVGSVLSSEYCRARETAQLMDLGQVLPTRELMNMRAAHLVGGRSAVIKRAQQVIGSYPEKGTNTVLVAHGNLMQAATGEYTVEGGAAVFAPKGDGTFTLVALISPEKWIQLAETVE